MHAPTPEQEQANEAVLALIALGYKQIDAHKAVRELQEEGEAKAAEDLVKLALNAWPRGDDSLPGRDGALRPSPDIAARCPTIHWTLSVER